ncbi:MAG: glycerol-3-phosphate dehydrogenase/oxidase [Acidimicrobiales bacterium]
MTGAFDRTDALRRLADTTFDVLVVGGGITGAGVALDAASRGLRTALVERDDFASGTSSKSSKLVHGGLRYLQQGEIGLVYEALAERQRLRRNAPHLVKVLPFLLPIFSKDGFIPPKLARALGSAMWTYDLTGGARIGKLHKRISADEAVAYMPTLPRDRLAASYLYYDAQADDARLTLTVARTAAIEHGAVVVNGCEVVGLHKDARGMADGATVRADGREIEVDATVVVNAAGVWSDDVRALDEGQHPHTIRPAKGIHITVPWRLVRNEIAVVIPVPKDSRSVFVVGWGDFTYIGTTDTDYDGPLDDPQCTPDDIAYLLRAINGSCSSEITEADIVGTWAGLRPLVADAHSEKTADLSRRHKVARSASGVITITGGKLTTYRRMAADTVDAVVEDLGDLPVGVQRRSRTKHLPLRGAEGFAELHARAADLSSTLDRATVEHLLTRYGSDARTVLAMVERRPELAAPIVPGLPYLEAEVRYAARYEMARSVDDVLSRRTRARLLGRDDSAAAAPRVAELLADELGWDAADQAAQVEAYRAAIEEERTAADLPAVALEAVLGG